VKWLVSSMRKSPWFLLIDVACRHHRRGAGNL